MTTRVGCMPRAGSRKCLGGETITAILPRMRWYCVSRCIDDECNGLCASCRTCGLQLRASQSELSPGGKRESECEQGDADRKSRKRSRGAYDSGWRKGRDVFSCDEQAVEFADWREAGEDRVASLRRVECAAGKRDGSCRRRREILP